MWKSSPLDPAPAPTQYGLPVRNGEIFISMGVWIFTLSGSPPSSIGQPFLSYVQLVLERISSTSSTVPEEALEHRQLSLKCSPLLWPEFLCMPLHASVGLCMPEPFRSNWSQNTSLPNVQARMLGGIFAPTRRATNHEVILKAVVFIKPFIFPFSFLSEEYI